MDMALVIHAEKNVKSLFVTNEHAAARHAAERDKGEKRNTIFAGDIGVRPDSIQIKRQQAQKRAMKILQDTFAADREMDQSMKEMAGHAEELQNQAAGYRKQLGEIGVARDELAENYGIEADSREVEDLELLRKERQANDPTSGVSLSEEEEKRLGEIYAEGLTGYEKDMLELDDREELLQNKIKGAQQGIEGIRSSLRDTKIERLKSNPMVKAQGDAEEIMMQANKEIYGDLINEGKQHIEEKLAEEKEKAQKIAEKKEEEEEKEAKKKEQEAQTEAWIEGTKEAAESSERNLPDASEVDQMYSYNNPDAAGKTEAEKEIEEMLQEMQLLKDDIKGAAVDAGL